MSFEYFIARRYIRAKQKHAFISLSTFLSTAGIAVGVMVMIVVIAVMSGADTQLKTKMLAITAHGVIMRHGGGFRNYQKILDTIKANKDVEAAMPYIYSQVILRSMSGLSGSILRGIDPETAGKVITPLKEAMLKELSAKKGNLALAPKIIIGKELASILKVKKGDQVSVMIPGGSGRPDRVPSVKRFEVAGFFDSGLYEFDKVMSYISLKEAWTMLGKSRGITGIEIRVKDIYRADTIIRKIVSELGRAYWGQDWMRMNHNIFSAIKLQKTVMFIILVLIILVAAFNIASALIMMVMGKTRDIAILKAMGATDKSIKKIFVYKGMVIGAIGTFTGTGLGFILCYILKTYKIIDLPTDVYFFSRLPVSLRFSDVAIIIITTLVICFFATLYPARKASKLNPADAFRYG